MVINLGGRQGSNKYMHKAKRGKYDEFYTILSDIEKELRHYKKHFKNKTVLCNCDDPRVSKFFHYFSYNFEQLGLKKLITTCYKNQQMELFSTHDSERAIWLEYNGDKNKNKIPDPSEIGLHHFKKDGDFRSEECIELLKEADIVVTNPPFSLFREYVLQLMKYNKKFLTIGNWNAVSYKEIFPLIRDNKMWIGVNSNRNFSGFIVPEHYELHGTEARIDEDGNRIVSQNNNCWFTNLDNDKRHESLILYKKYTQTDYPKFNNYDAINVDQVKDIPVDYDGMIGVPITFMNKYNPDQFEIMDSNDIRSSPKVPFKKHGLIKDKEATIIGESKPKYVRMIIKHKKT
jgi:hypothetical protein